MAPKAMKTASVAASLAPKAMKTTVMKSSLKIRPASGHNTGENKLLQEIDGLQDSMPGSASPEGPAMEHQAEIRAKTRQLELEVEKSKAGIGSLPGHVVRMYDQARGLKHGRHKAIRDIASQALENVEGKHKYKLAVS